MMNSFLQYKKICWLLVGVCCSFILRGQSPGGVTGAAIWLKANVGVTTGATLTWADQSGNSRSGTQSTAGFQPTVISSSINFNPALTFDGIDDRLVLSNLTGLPTGTSQVQAFGVMSNSNVAGGWMCGFAYGSIGINTSFGLEKGSGSANAVLNMSSTDVISTALEFTGGAPALCDIKYTGTQGVISSFGLSRTTTTVSSARTTNLGRVGSHLNDTEFWTGKISEIIFFPTNLNATQTNQVNSYLAIKYGITLSPGSAMNYTASDGSTVFWTGNATYQNNIAGIARDDAGGAANTGLNQKQSKSVNTGLQVAMGNGNTIATDNASNSNTFSADKSALIWGDNAGSVAAWTSTGAPSNTRQILARTWKVQETGTVGSVKVQIADNASSGLPAEVTTVYLLVDADGNFASGATEVAMTLNGSNWEANVDFTSGQFFTFATQVPPAPGGVTGAAIWLKADVGVTTGATFTWADQSGNSRNGTQATATNQPTVNSSLINFNPALVLDGTNDYLTLQNISGLPTGAAQVEAFGVARNLNTAGSWNHIISYGGAAGNSYFTLGKQTGTANAVTGFNGSDAISAALEYTGGATVLCDGKYTGTIGVISTFGKQQGTVTFTGAKATTNGRIGVDPTPSLTTCWNGSIAETVLYPTNLTATQVNQVNSYLAIKYGVTLDQTSAQNYTASDGATIYWNGTTNSAYKNNITGIARDDASALSQKQSKSVNTGLQLVMGNGNTIAADNISNTNTFSADKSALVWGDDAGSVAAWTTTGAPPSRQIVARKWKTQETGTVGYVKVQVPDNGGTNGLPAETNTVYLLVDADGNFASGATEVAMTLNGTNWEAPVDFTNGQFFTFATQENSPVNLNLAMTADKTTVSSGQNVTYTLTLTNSGTNTATNVQIKDKLPAGVNFVSATPSSGTYNSTTGVWTLPSVAGAAAPTLTIIVTAQ